jgi:hypothetical protein
MYQAAVAGELWLDDGVGQACAAQCQELIDELDARAAAIGTLADGTGFGGFTSAQQLQDGFRRKAGTARDTLIGYRGVVESMREVFLAADRSDGLREHSRTVDSSVKEN